MLPQRVPEEGFGVGLRRAVGPLHPPSTPVVAVFEHILVLRVQRPVVALAFAAPLSGHLHEALVEAEVVADGVLPALLVALEVGELGRDVLVNLGEGSPLEVRRLDGHGDERHVRVRRLALAARGATVRGG